MYVFYPPKRLFTMPYLYVYLIFKSTKNMNIKIESIIKSCMLDKKETFMEFSNLYMDRRDHIR